MEQTREKDAERGDIVIQRGHGYLEGSHRRGRRDRIMQRGEKMRQVVTADGSWWRDSEGELRESDSEVEGEECDSKVISQARTLFCPSPLCEDHLNEAQVRIRPSFNSLFSITHPLPQDYWTG